MKHRTADLWGAVARRDPRFDRVFVYGVASTHVYCRPSCPSRRPHREHVTFFPAPGAAEQAGYRPCRRCRPEQPADGHPHARLVERICRLIDSSLDEPLRLEALSRAAGVSPFHLQRTFTRVLGISPRQYAEARRLLRLKTGLRQGQDVTTALYDAGYGSSSRLYERSHHHLGMTPATYRRGGAGARIRYTVVSSPLGRMLLAATSTGVCAVKFGDSGRKLARDLAREFSAAELSLDRRGLARWAGQLAASMHEGGRAFDIPLDLRATAFQWKVWEALRAIPRGATRSYRQVAQAIGRPRAVRAVARACATNPVAVLIPCHRVVRTDGALGGYRWGMERKKTLLKTEAGS
ncbi:MAG TPA: bifunctional DNA-binding transcriptional regulator/O6-methylguanine-DNA methyltransferase Ada [Terriglobales bacterium]|nr:bifunctional DNA-binding transcriptional regulator/O6-methylguanine-DNA methyltransferase Ada [Terriglobales bacterium]